MPPNATIFARSLSTLPKYLISNLNIICTRIHPFDQPNSVIYLALRQFLPANLAIFIPNTSPYCPYIQKHSPSPPPITFFSMSRTTLSNPENRKPTATLRSMNHGVYSIPYRNPNPLVYSTIAEFIMTSENNMVSPHRLKR